MGSFNALTINKKKCCNSIRKVYKTFTAGSGTSNITQKETYGSEEVPEN